MTRGRLVEALLGPEGFRGILEQKCVKTMVFFSQSGGGKHFRVDESRDAPRLPMRADRGVGIKSRHTNIGDRRYKTRIPTAEDPLGNT